MAQAAAVSTHLQVLLPLTAENVGVSGRQWRCYRLPPSEVRYITLLYEVILTLTLTSAKQQAERAISALTVLTGGKLPDDQPCLMNYLEHFERFSENLESHFSKLCQHFRFDDTSGIPSSQRETLKIKVIAFARIFFSGLEPIIVPKDVKSQTYTNYLEKTGYQSSGKLRLELCRYTLVAKKLKLSSEDLAFLELPPEEKPPSARKLDCGAYAFLTLREPRAKEWIRSSLDKGQPNPTKEAFYCAEGLTLLEEWGYRPIQSPAPQDLVVYLGNLSSLHVTHVGIVRENGLIQSKIGIQDPGIYLHPLSDVLGHYGMHVLFFRR